MLHSLPSALQQRPIITLAKGLQNIFKRQRDDCTSVSESAYFAFRREYITYLSTENNRYIECSVKLEYFKDI